ncbi:MAG: ASCH domain-containing protein [Acidocella sp.]|nr:ASCH domain-containing protein [Acidocella sp.]
MPISDSAAALWRTFASARGEMLAMPEITVFGLGEAQQTELCALVLSGQKRATTSLAAWYKASGEALPKTGDLAVVCDGTGAAHGIIETIDVEIVPFIAVTGDFAAAEGEGDGSLNYWRAAHRDYFTQTQAEDGGMFSEDMLVVCQRFRLLWPTG